MHQFEQMSVNAKDFTQVKKAITKCMKKLKTESNRRRKATQGECERLGPEIVRCAVRDMLLELDLRNQKADIEIWCGDLVWG